MTLIRCKVPLLFFLGSVVANPVGYLLGTGLGAWLGRSAFGLSGDAMSTGAGKWFLFGGASIGIASLNLLVFLCLMSQLRQPNKTQQPTGAPSGAGG